MYVVENPIHSLSSEVCTKSLMVKVCAKTKSLIFSRNQNLLGTVKLIHRSLLGKVFVQW